MTRLRSIALAATLLLPATVAFAQPVPDPNDPNRPSDPTVPPAPTPNPSPTDEPTNPPPPPAPPPAPVEPGPTVIVNPPPAATVVRTEPAYETVQDPFNAPVFASGAILFAGAYGGSAIAAASMDRDERKIWGERLYIPVAGPWLALNDIGDCSRALPNCNDSNTVKALLVADGIVQGIGVVGMFAGLVSPSYHTRPVRTAMDTKVHVRPTVVGHSGSGVTVFGRW